MCQESMVIQDWKSLAERKLVGFLEVASIFSEKKWNCFRQRPGVFPPGSLPSSLVLKVCSSLRSLVVRIPKGDSSKKSLFCFKKPEDPGFLGVLVLPGVLVESCGGDFVVQELWSQFDAVCCSKRLVIQVVGPGWCGRSVICWVVLFSRVCLLDGAVFWEIPTIPFCCLGVWSCSWLVRLNFPRLYCLFQFDAGFYL